jgi:SNF2 family DNA or RNA helicase
MFSKDIMKLKNKLDYKGQPTVVVSNYHKLTKSVTGYWKFYQKIHWSTVVCDEAHFFRNAHSERAKYLSTLKRDAALLLTGM